MSINYYKHENVRPLDVITLKFFQLDESMKLIVKSYYSLRTQKNFYILILIILYGKVLHYNFSFPVNLIK